MNLFTAFMNKNIFTKKFEIINNINKSDWDEKITWYDNLFGFLFYWPSFNKLKTVLKLLLIVLCGVLVGIGIFIFIGEILIR